MRDPKRDRNGADDTTSSDTDADPGNLNPRDERGEDDYEGDTDADPGNLNPRGA